MIKRIFWLLCTAIFMLTSFSYAAETQDAETLAWVDFSDNKAMRNFSAVSFATDTAAVSGVNTVNINGSQCWNMTGGGNFQYIRFNISNSAVNGVKDGTEYAIFVEYYDGDITNQKQGFFSLEYDSVDRKRKTAGMILLTNSGTWKTAKFVLDDAYFGTRMMNRAADFRLTIVPQKSMAVSVSPTAVAIKSVRVVPTGVKRSIRVVSETSRVGNTFAWDVNDKIIKNTLKNTQASSITADFTFKAMLDGDKTVFSQTKTLTIGANSSVTENITLPVERCGVYDWIVTVSMPSGVSYDRKCMKFVVIKTDKDGIKNDKAYVGHHLNRYFDSSGENREIKEGMELIEKSNAGGIRAESSWGELKPLSSSTLKFEGTSMELISNLAKQHKLAVTWLLSGGNYAVTGAWNSYPDTASEISAYKEYVKYTAEKVKDSASSFEMAHEIDNTGYNPIINKDTGEFDATPQEYFNLIKETKAALNEANANKPLIGYGLIGLDRSVTVWIDSVLDSGLLDYLDIFSYHPYTHSFCGEKAWNLWYFAPRVKQKLKNANANATMAVTEVGTSIANDTYIDGKRSRGANNCRTAIAYTGRDLAEFVTHYVFEDKGQLGEIEYEDGYGMVGFAEESLIDDSGAIFVPNDSFVSFTAMNYVLAESEPWQIFELGDDVSATGFTSSKFNNKVVVLNTVGSSDREEMYGAYDITKPITVKLGTNAITCFDDFGNESLLTSENGIYTFMLNERPLYIVGNITEVTASDGAKAGIDSGLFVLDGTTVLNVFAPTDKTYTAELFMPDYMTAAKNMTISGGTVAVPMKFNGEPTGKSVSEAVIKDESGNNVFFGQIMLKASEKSEFTVDSVTTNLDFSSDPSETSISEIKIEFSGNPPSGLQNKICLLNSDSEKIAFTKTVDLNICTLTLDEAVEKSYGMMLYIGAYTADGASFNGYEKVFGSVDTDFLYLFFDMNGNSISAEEAGALTSFKMNLLAPNNIKTEAWKLICAKYKNDTLTDVDTEDIKLISGVSNVVSDVVLSRGDGEKFKLMIWKSINAPTPNGSALTIGK